MPSTRGSEDKAGSPWIWRGKCGGQIETPNHLAEVVGSKPGRRIYGENATYPPFWAYSRTLPQGVELLVQPLVKSLFCPINASPNEFLVRTPPDPPHLKPTF